MRSNYFLAIAVLAFSTGCGRSTPATADAKAPAQSPAIQTIQVRASEVEDVLDIPAKVEPDPAKVVRVFPPASGRVLELNVRPGDRVTQNQTIAIFQSSDVAQARSDFEKAKADADRAARADRRSSDLYQHGAISQKDYDDAHAEAIAARSELDRAQQRLLMLGGDPNGSFDRIAIRAPKSGVVVDMEAAPGELARSLESSPPLVSIADLTTVWVLGDVFEKDLHRVRVGDAVNITLDAYPGEQWKGIVSNVSDMLDPTQRTSKVRVVLSNPGHRLKPEMFAAIHLVNMKREAILVPAVAVLREGDFSYVFRRAASGEFAKTSVKLGAQHGDQVEIIAGLSSGEQVAAQGAELLREQTESK